jgi:uracil-DNA glycosylase family 4
MDARRAAMLKEMGIAIWTERGAAMPEAEASQAGPQAHAAPASPPRRAAAMPAPAGSAEMQSPQGEREQGIAMMDWPALKAAVPACTACALHASRTQTVFGVGDEQAEWLLVGEAPGGDEDRLGEPFVGQAGKLLDQMLSAIELARGRNVYIANVLKCRPPGNRNPQPEEVARCAPHLLRQIDLIKPRLILAMGRFAAQTLLATDASIASLRGKLHAYHGVPLIVTYHPAYLLRTPEDKAKSWQDLLFAVRTMQGLQSAASAPT